MNYLTVILGALELGGIFAILALGVYVSYKVLSIPDLTVDGSFTTGCAVSAVVTLGLSPELGIVMAFFAGALAGSVSGLLMTKLKIDPILSGILTQIGLYSINLHIMSEKPNIALINKTTIFSRVEGLGRMSELILIYSILMVITAFLAYFLKTQMGVALRACGDNEDMVRASSIDTDKMKIMGLALANGLVAVSGAIYTQHQCYADISAGIGMMVIGLASIIIGLTFIRTKNTFFSLLATIVGAVFYRFVLTIALQIGLPASDLKILSAIIVVAAIASANVGRRKKA